MRRLSTPIVLALLLCTTGWAGAQANPDSVKRLNDCRLAAQTLVTGHPAPKMDWAISFISSCGGDGAEEAMAAAIRRSRASVDTGFLSDLSRQAGYFADGGIFAAALAVAGDPTASAPARIFALLTLQTIIAPRSRITYAEATSGLDANGSPACTRITREVTDALVRPGATPLPPDYVEQAHSLKASLQRDASVPPLVRAAAQCPM